MSLLLGALCFNIMNEILILLFTILTSSGIFLLKFKILLHIDVFEISLLKFKIVVHIDVFK